MANTSVVGANSKSWVSTLGTINLDYFAVSVAYTPSYNTPCMVFNVTYYSYLCNTTTFFYFFISYKNVSFIK